MGWPKAIERTYGVRQNYTTPRGWLSIGEYPSRILGGLALVKKTITARAERSPKTQGSQTWPPSGPGQKDRQNYGGISGGLAFRDYLPHNTHMDSKTAVQTGSPPGDLGQKEYSHV